MRLVTHVLVPGLLLLVAAIGITIEPLLCSALCGCGSNRLIKINSIWQVARKVVTIPGPGIGRRPVVSASSQTFFFFASFISARSLSPAAHRFQKKTNIPNLFIILCQGKFS